MQLATSDTTNVRLRKPASMVAALGDSSPQTTLSASSGMISLQPAEGVGGRIGVRGVGITKSFRILVGSMRCGCRDLGAEHLEHAGMIPAVEAGSLISAPSPSQTR